jgi:hypothetical protein
MNTHRPILHLIMLNYKILIKQIVSAIKKLHGLVEIYFISVNNIYWINCMSYNNITYIGIRKQVTQHLYKIFSQIPKKKRKENTCKMVRTCTLIYNLLIYHSLKIPSHWYTEVENLCHYHILESWKSIRIPAHTPSSPPWFKFEKNMFHILIQFWASEQKMFNFLCRLGCTPRKLYGHICCYNPHFYNVIYF